MYALQCRVLILIPKQRFRRPSSADAIRSASPVSPPTVIDVRKAAELENRRREKEEKRRRERENYYGLQPGEILIGNSAIRIRRRTHTLLPNPVLGTEDARIPTPEKQGRTTKKQERMGGLVRPRQPGCPVASNQSEKPEIRPINLLVMSSITVIVPQADRTAAPNRVGTQKPQNEK